MTPEYVFKDLEGRLECVQLDHIISETSAYAKFGDKFDKLAIVRSLKTTGSGHFLVRFMSDLSTQRTLPFSRFITSQVPQEFHSLAPPQYVLTGTWLPEMTSADSLPTLNEINQYYDPGDMPIVAYLKHGSTTRRGRRWITSRGAISKSDNFARLMRYLPDPHRASRVILAGSEEELERITKVILDYGLVPVRMEPLR